MKTVFSSNAEVAHVWAQQSQSEGRGSHFFFEGKSIYSYGHHFKIAEFVKPDVVLFNEDNYSPSTGRHKNIVSHAIVHKTVFVVPSFEDHNENVLNYVAHVKDEIERFKRARKGLEYHLDYIDRTIKIANEYLEVFGNKIKQKVKKEVLGLETYKLKNLPESLIEAKLEKEKANEKLAEAKRQERYRIERLKQEEKLELWLKGEYDGTLYNLPVHLRIKDNNIETTKGAEVPLIEARKLWHLLQDNKPIEGVRVGYYTVTGIEGRELVIGCHRIPLTEIYRSAKVLGWLNQKELAEVK